MKLCLFVLITLCASVSVLGAQLKTDIANAANEPSTKNFEHMLFELHHVLDNVELNINEKLFVEELKALEESVGRNIIGDIVNNMLEDIRDVIVNGNDNIGPLDPLVIEEAGPVVTTASGVTISAMIYDFSITGIRWFVLDDFSFNPITLALRTHLTVPWVIVNGNYNAQARIGFIQHTSGGIVNIFVHRVEVGLAMRLGFRILSGQLFLRELNIKIDIHDTQVSISGLTGSSVLNGLINAILQSTTQQIIQDQVQNVSALLSSELFDIIDNILSDFTINDILGLASEHV